MLKRYMEHIIAIATDKYWLFNPIILMYTIGKIRICKAMIHKPRKPRFI
jgi:hypothetical protein